ncbi:MAG: quinone oxidoreductase [Rhizobiales bacterium]|nr:quinone oxidoreductase [Hyphomicrobiales bacterium]
MTSAICITEFGGVDTLKLQDINVGAPGKGEVKLQQAASGLNFIDVYHRTGAYPNDLPLIPGVEGSGTVIEVGENVTNVKIGDRVAYAGPIGSYAEQRLISADNLVLLPDEITFEQAAGMMLQGMTAQMLLRQVYKVKAGDTILIHAAAGGTGSIMSQWANHLGVKVIGTVSTPQKAEIAKANGCHETILYTQTDFVEEVKSLTGGKGVDVVYDSVGATTFIKSLDCIKPMGTMVTFGQSSGPIEPILPITLMQKGSLHLTRPFLFHYIATPKTLNNCASELFEVVKSEIVKTAVNQSFALRDAANAHTQLEARATTGSTILTI